MAVCHFKATRFFWAILIVVGLVFSPANVSAQTPIDRIQGLFHQQIFPKAQPATNTYRNQSGSSWDTNGDLTSDQRLALLGLVGLGVTSPIWVPAAVFDSGYNQPCHWPSYPYMGEKTTASIIGECQSCDILKDPYWDNPLFLKGWSLRNSLDYSQDFRGLNRIGGELFLDTNFYRLGYLAHFNYYRASSNGSTADAFTFDSNATFRTVQNEWMFLHVGLGGRLWEAYDEVHGGINALYRGDFFPMRPLHIGTLAEIGNLDRLLFVHVQANVGFTWRHGEIFLGYDFTRISRVNLQGPTLGIRLWF